MNMCTNESIYEELNDQLSNFNTNKEEIKNLVDNATIISSNESPTKRTKWKAVKPLDLFDDTREGGPGNIEDCKTYIAEVEGNDLVSDVIVNVPSKGKVFADDPVEDEGLEEALECEDDDSTGEEVSAPEFGITEKTFTEFSFGKNGDGITDELTRIGKRVEELAKNHYVYLVDSRLDPLNDVYVLTLETYERN